MPSSPGKAHLFFLFFCCALLHALIPPAAYVHPQDQMEKLAQLIRDVITAAPWKTALPIAASQRYGISALVAREKGEIARSRDAIREAFRGDLEELKVNAKKMVALSEAFTAKLRKGEVDDADAAEFQTYLTSLGIADPVTKKACGGSESKFHRELAAELGRVLSEPLAKHGGMMQLQDVYVDFPQFKISFCGVEPFLVKIFRASLSLIHAKITTQVLLVQPRPWHHADFSRRSRCRCQPLCRGRRADDSAHV